MTREDILLNSIWTSGKLIVHSLFFQAEVRIDLLTSEYNLKNTHQIISEKFVQCINDFLQLPGEGRPLMQQLLYKHCLACCESTSYGVDILEGETETEANLREFGVAAPEDALKKANLDHVVVEENKFLKNRFVTLVFYPQWEQEHGCELILKNGRLLDFSGEGGTYLAQFDTDE
ncbi:MAG: hypothetical protein AAFV25_00055 [Bacteroidota bacterium]